MNLSAVKAICSWQYPEPYDVYNYMCFWENQKLSAYINIYTKDDKVFIGIGLSPDCCGKVTVKLI